MKKKLTIFFLTFIIILIVMFNQKLIELYVINKFSKWVEKDVLFEDFQITYPNIITVKNLKIKNTNPFYYDLIFETKSIFINVDIKSFLFGNLRIINNLMIDEPKFYLEVIQKNLKLEDQIESDTQIVFEDNIGIAKKLSQNLSDKIWVSLSI